MTRPALLATLGWLTISAGLGLNYGPWVTVVALGLGAVVTGLFIQARDGILDAIAVYFTSPAPVEGSTPAPAPQVERPRRLHT